MQFNQEMLAQFVAIVQDAKSSGSRVFKEWASHPEKFLRSQGLPIDDVLLGLSESEKEKFQPLLQFFTSMSFYYLFKHLEEGEGSYSFALTMNDGSGKTCHLIGENIDHDIRNQLL